MFFICSYTTQIEVNKNLLCFCELQTPSILVTQCLSKHANFWRIKHLIYIENMRSIKENVEIYFSTKTIILRVKPAEVHIVIHFKNGHLKVNFVSLRTTF